MTIVRSAWPVATGDKPPAAGFAGEHNMVVCDQVGPLMRLFCYQCVFVWLDYTKKATGTRGVAFL